MADPYDDALSRLSWALRRYFWVLGIGTALALAVALWGSAAFSPRQPGTTYRARAFVAATTLTLRTDQLPRLATAVFTSTAVAESAVLRGGLPYDAEDLIPKYAQIDPVADNVVIFVDGLASEPRLAAQVANATAFALVDELNKLGTGIGTFALQQPADVPTRPVSEPALPLPLVASIAAGPLVALGLIVLITVVRQPVLSRREIEAIVAVPALEVCLPRGMRRHPNAARVIGLSALVKTLFNEHHGMVVVFSCRADRHVPALVSYMSQVLSRDGNPPVAELSREDSAEIKAPITAVPHRAGHSSLQAPVMVEGPPLAGLDLPQFMPTSARALLVVPKGVPRSALRSVARQFLQHELAATAIIATSRRWHLPRSRRSSKAAVDLTSGGRMWRDRQIGSGVPAAAIEGDAMTDGNETPEARRNGASRRSNTVRRIGSRDLAAAIEGDAMSDGDESAEARRNGRSRRWNNAALVQALRRIMGPPR